MPPVKKPSTIALSQRVVDDFLGALDLYIETQGLNTLDYNSSIAFGGIQLGIGSIMNAVFDGRIREGHSRTIRDTLRQTVLTELGLRGITKELLETHTFGSTPLHPPRVQNGSQIKKNREALREAQERYVNYIHRFHTTENLRYIRERIALSRGTEQYIHLGASTLDKSKFTQAIDDLIRFNEISPISLRPYPGTALARRVPTMRLESR